MEAHIHSGRERLWSMKEWQTILPDVLIVPSTKMWAWYRWCRPQMLQSGCCIRLRRHMGRRFGDGMSAHALQGYVSIWATTFLREDLLYRNLFSWKIRCQRYCQKSATIIAPVNWTAGIPIQKMKFAKSISEPANWMPSMLDIEWSSLEPIRLESKPNAADTFRTLLLR